MNPFDIVIETCEWPRFDQMDFERGIDAWKQIRGGVVRSKKQTEWETVDHWHVRDGGLWSNDWLENKQKTKDFITCGTYVTP